MIGNAMSDQRTLPPHGQSFVDQPHAFDPVTQPQLFHGVIGKRTVAFIIDAMIILMLTVIDYVVVAYSASSRSASPGSFSVWSSLLWASVITR